MSSIVWKFRVKSVKNDINKLHTLLGHPCELISRKTGKEMDLEVVGKYETCVNCALEKISQKKKIKKTQTRQLYQEKESILT